MSVANDFMKENPRLGDEALGPCAVCQKPILETFPIFYRVQVTQCAIDMGEVRRHVGLAQAIAPGADGLQLASILGPKVEPVVVVQGGQPFNVCTPCQNRPDYMMLAEFALREGEG